MDLIYAAKKIFDLSIYPYQIQVLIISKDLREFFKKDHLNSIEFWDCLSYDKWTLHDIVDRETKKFDLVPIFLYNVRIIDGGLDFIFLFSFFSFSIFRTARVRVDWSRCHISHKLMVKSQD